MLEKKLSKTTCVSDLHGFLDFVPQASDLLIIAGDVCRLDNHNLEDQLKWLNSEFNEWIKEQKNRFKDVVWIAGNHDLILERLDQLNITDKCLNENLFESYLKDSSYTTKLGLVIWGTPWTPLFGDWAFMRKESVLNYYFDHIPEGIDILVSHGPPKSYRDFTYSYFKEEMEHVGSESLLNAIKRVKPKLVCCGHIHGAYGQTTIDFDDFGFCKVVNCSIMTEQYTPKNPPVVVEIEKVIEAEKVIEEKVKNA